MGLEQPPKFRLVRPAEDSPDEPQTSGQCPDNPPILRLVDELENEGIKTSDHHLGLEAGEVRAEMGVTERSVAKCVVSIQEYDLDLDACIGKGGSWEVAARRVREARRLGKLQELFNNSRALGEDELDEATRDLHQQLKDLGVSIDVRVADEPPE